MWFYFLYCMVALSGWIKPVSPKGISIHKNGSPLKEKPNPRISFGEQSEIHFHPYQFQLLTRDETFCSGAIISDRYLVTAAHCVQNVTRRDVVVRVGNVIRGKGTTTSITDIKLHPEYDDSNNDNDIAIMKTARPIEFGRQVQAATLPETEDDFMGDSIVISGWGDDGRDTDFEYDDMQISSRLTNELNAESLTIIRNTDCEKTYPGMITLNMFCAQDPRTRNKGACKGDGGAPAVQGANYTLYGLSSFTMGCGYDMGPSVFTRITAEPVRNFITDNTGL